VLYDTSYGLIFYNSKPALIKLIGMGVWGKVYSIVFTNNMELVIKTSESYLANYNEIQNIKRLTRNKQSPYVCYYYGYTTMENNKCIFVSTNKNLKFVGSFGELPNRVLNKKINGNAIWNITKYNYCCAVSLNHFISTYWTRVIHVKPQL
jgi:hypothetical protein